MKTFKIGDRVRFKGMRYACHTAWPEYYPEDGTIGTITEIASANEIKVQWEHGSTSGKDEWWAPYNCLELVGE